MKLKIQEVNGAEFIHFVDSRTLISSLGNRINISSLNENKFIYLPINGLTKPLYWFRILRRLLRLDTINVYVLQPKKLKLLIIYQGKVYVYSHDSKLELIGKLESGRNILHNGFAQTKDGNLFFGEYFGNNENIPVNIYKFISNQKKLEIVYTFPKNTIRHVHKCHWDEYTERFWVFTGDRDDETQIITFDSNFSNERSIGRNSQIYRAVSAIFTKKYVYWFMDSPIETSHLIKYCRKTESIYKMQSFPSPVYFSLSLQDGGHLIGTTHEPGESVKGKKAHIFYSEDLENWNEVGQFNHDGMSLQYFKYATVSFSAGIQTKKEFYISCQAIKKMDGKSYRCSIYEKTKTKVL